MSEIPIPDVPPERANCVRDASNEDATRRERGSNPIKGIEHLFLCKVLQKVGGYHGYESARLLCKNSPVIAFSDLMHAGPTRQCHLLRADINAFSIVSIGPQQLHELPLAAPDVKDVACF
jgi:hypothetical protein